MIKATLAKYLLATTHPFTVSQGLFMLADMDNPPQALLDRVKRLSEDYPDPLIRGRCIALLGSLQPDLYTGDILNDTSKSDD